MTLSPTIPALRVTLMNPDGTALFTHTFLQIIAARALENFWLGQNPKNKCIERMIEVDPDSPISPPIPATLLDLSV